MTTNKISVEQILKAKRDRIRKEEMEEMREEIRIEKEEEALMEYLEISNSSYWFVMTFVGCSLIIGGLIFIRYGRITPDDMDGLLRFFLTAAVCSILLLVLDRLYKNNAKKRLGW